MKRIKLTKNFYLDEFTRSEIATRMGRLIQADELVRLSIFALCTDILQPLRNDLRRAIHITSGYRPTWLNKFVGGSKRSEHRYGRAADFVVSGRSPLYACEAILALELPINQVIHEFDQWTHVSWANKNLPLRSQVLTARKDTLGRTRYTKGLREITA